MKRLGVDIRLSTAVDETVVRAVEPDVLMIAVGGEPIVPPLPGVDGENVVIGKYLRPDTKLGRRIAVIGGGLVGCETAVHLADKGHTVTVIEMQDDVAKDCGHFHRIALLEELKKVALRTGHRCTRITSEGVYAVSPEGKEVLVEADTVIVAAGMRARQDAVEKLRGLVTDYVVLGDALRARNILAAVRNAYDAAMNLA